ncbi:type IV pili twitching motility protein PilT [Candidatus Gracilibacteria bacterium]|nr:MAG: type IV pili twitching motility protein PilT [Candidatus Gracilibacteria bacterium]
MFYYKNYDKIFLILQYFNEKMKIAKILKESLEKGASDVILTTDSDPVLKVNGDIVYLSEYGKYESEELKQELFSIMSEKQKNTFVEELELDFSIDLKGYSRFRVNSFFSKNGPGAVFRSIKTEIPSFEQLLLPRKLLEFAGRKNGLILVTGGVGSGKSTTMSAILNYIINNYSKHIITVEDPIEYVFRNGKSLVEQREVGTSTKSFESGLKYALRQASDVIMIGEMRDLETFRLALRAAETGNLVIATLHTSGTARTISRIIDMFPGEEKEYIRAQLSVSLLGVIWQDLLKTKDGKARVLSSELLVNNSSISNMIRKGDIHQIPGVLETGAKDGMYTMDHNLKKLREAGLIE